MTIGEYFTYAGIATVIILIWQHIAMHVVDSWFRPTWFIRQLVRFCEFVYENLGRCFAWISGIAEYLHLRQLGETVAEFAYAFYDLLTSWRHFVSGYVAVIREHNWTRSVIVTGSIIITLLIGVCIWYFSNSLSKAYGFLARALFRSKLVK